MRKANELGLYFYAWHKDTVLMINCAEINSYAPWSSFTSVVDNQCLPNHSCLVALEAS